MILATEISVEVAKLSVKQKTEEGRPQSLPPCATPMEGTAAPLFFGEPRTRRCKWECRHIGLAPPNPFSPWHVGQIPLKNSIPEFGSDASRTQATYTAPPDPPNKHCPPQQTSKDAVPVDTPIARKGIIKTAREHSARDGMKLKGPGNVELDLMDLVDQKRKDLQDLTVNKGLCAIEVEHLQRMTEAKRKASPSHVSSESCRGILVQDPCNRRNGKISRHWLREASEIRIEGQNRTMSTDQQNGPSIGKTGSSSSGYSCSGII